MILHYIRGKTEEIVTSFFLICYAYLLVTDKGIIMLLKKHYLEGADGSYVK